MKTLITGCGGMVGSLIDGDIKIKKEYNLTNIVEVDKMLEIHQPTHIINCAAKVGGIGGNAKNMAQYFYDNLLIGTNVIESARKHNVEKVLNFSSTCVFPEGIDFPLTEEKIHLGPPHETNYGYAYAKRLVEIQIKSYYQEYGLRYFSVIPCNIYGFNDNYNLETSHVIPSLIHKVYLAKTNNQNLNVWGSGKAQREFIFAKDVAEISKKLLMCYDDIKPVIISPSIEVSIEELVLTICDILKFNGKINFEKNKLEGQMRKPSDNSYLKSIIGEYNFTPLYNGLCETIEYFQKNYDKIRK